MHEQDQRSGALLDQVQAPGRSLDAAVAELDGRLGLHGDLLGWRRTRLPIDHAARHPPDAITLANLANSQDRAVEWCGKGE
ncbi:hypothetical protein JCM4814A_81980 [Streptomyces phaeofaciens JCM 4814]|uniref:Uncharacterized protein n=1 Tax=Streptomyces phaeofaciens TaxID=68254 RepID=A0A918HP87_9ACTN|nr:hypothetical protein GCM10010226_80000 [Streptomyces phaeofaciens]